MLSPDGKSWMLIAYGCICRAIMLCKERYGDHPNVLATLAAGLLLDEYHSRTPKDIIVWLRDFYNKFGGGTGFTV